MKNNWVRLIAGVLVSVALVGAISLTGGMKKGSRTDGLLYEASGLHPDGQLLMVNGKTVTCEEYLYWLAYDCEYLSTYVQDIDWSAELTSGITYGDYAQTPVEHRLLPDKQRLLVEMGRRYGAHLEKAAAARRARSRERARRAREAAIQGIRTAGGDGGGGQAPRALLRPADGRHNGV